VARLGQAAIDAWEESAVPPPGWAVDPVALAAAWAALLTEAGPGDTLAVTSNGIARFALAGFGQGVLPKLKTGAFGEIRLTPGASPEVVAWNVRP
jgi:probable phosphoglycerate mutase